MDTPIRRKIKKREHTQKLREQENIAWQVRPLRLRYIQLSGKNKTPLITRLALEKSDYGVMAYHEHWHTEVFERFICTQEVGYVFTVPEVYAHLGLRGIKLHPNPTYRSKAIVAYLERLEEEGYLELKYSMGLVESIQVWNNSLLAPMSIAMAGSASHPLGVGGESGSWVTSVEEMIRSNREPPSLSDLCQDVPNGTRIEEVLAHRDAMVLKYWR